jgi:enterochelin esterase-like enzyme
MALTGRSFLALCVLSAVALPAAALLLWPRVRGRPVLRGLQRLTLIGACQLTAVVLIAVLVNNSFGFYTSWGDLLGTSNGAVVVGGTGLLPTRRAAESAQVNDAFRTRRLRTGGVVLNYTIHGPRSGISAPALVYLPPEYGQARYRHTRFPVVTVMPGYPGNPLMWLHHHLPLPTFIRHEVARGKATPFVAVIVSETVAPPRDTECADVVGGPHVETFLAQDVRSQVAAVLRVRTDRAGWSLMGDSTGGFCATKIAMRHPRLYGSAVSLSGFYTAIQDVTTGELYGGSTALRERSDPLWRLRHLPAPPIDLLVTSSRQERTYPQTQALLSETKPPMNVTSYVATTGGHNTRAWSLMLPRAIDWLRGEFGPLQPTVAGAAACGSGSC